jgi:protein-S-isoprenylcysteine O-methyltransferase Ste14
MAAWRLAAGIVVVALILLLPAGDIAYWEAWVYMGLLFIPVTIVGSLLLTRDPELLERRLRARERQPGQAAVVLVSSVVMLPLLILPGLDHRFGWSQVPLWVVIAADLLILLGYILFALTLRENSYASRVVEVESSQRVIDTGPYSLVRHPMYLAMCIMFVLTPLALGSWWGLVPALVFPLTLVGRIRQEEDLLRSELPGYAEYCQRVRYRLVPMVW